MPRFPKSEPEIIALAQQIVTGMANNPLFANAPMTSGAFQTKLEDFTAKRDEIFVDEAALSEKYDDKEDLKFDLTETMKQLIGFLQAMSNNDPSEMASIGIGADSPRISAAPSQPRTLEIVSQTNAEVKLDWKNPSQGNVSAYRVERREMPNGDWQICFSGKESEAALVNQPKGKELEYRAIAFNANGDSPPSNTVTLTL